MTDFVYVIKCDAGPVKIGVSEQPLKRLADLQSACPFELKLAHTIDCGGRAYEIESAAHLLLSDHHLRGEWFSVSVDSAIRAIDDAFDGAVTGAPALRQAQSEIIKARLANQREMRERELKEQSARFLQIRTEQAIARRKHRRKQWVKGDKTIPAYLR